MLQWKDFRNAIHAASKNVSIIFLCLLCFGALFSCNNVSNSSGGTLQNGAGQRTVILKGTISANSALPAEIAAAVSPLTGANGSVSRSAFPDINTANYYKFVTAVQTDGSGRYTIGRDDQDKFSAEGGVLAFELRLAQGHWEITTGIKMKMGGDEADDVTVLSDYCEKTVDLSEPVISHVFAIVPSQSGDADKAGSIELYVGSDPSLGADQLILLCSDEKFRAVWDDPMLHVVTLGGGALVSIDPIQSGNYEITFCFLKEGRHVFSTVQTISVFDYMKTNKWLPDGTGLISDSGAFNVTQDLANSQLDSAIYVGVHKDLSSVEGIDASDSNSGHAYEPLRTLQAAVDKIAVYGNSATPYTVYVSGTLPKDKLQIPAALNSKARSLKICGLDPPGDDGTPVSAIDADGSGTALTVLTSVPVTLENIKITGGNNTLGGGICVASGADVTLKENAVVADNKASFGGGVYVAGSFTLDGGTIGDASAEEHATDILYSNKAGEKGGGLAFASTGKVTFKKGVVAYNYSKRGGGIATSFDVRSDSSRLDFKGGEVRYNCAGPYDDFVLGGGLFLKGCKFYFTGGKVHHNYAGDGGGGIGLEKTVAASMSGGSVYDNEYRNTTPGTKVDHKWGSDILLFDDATLDMSGGEIYSSSQKDYGVMIRTSICALNISGRAEISKETPVLVGDIIYNIGHDTYTYNDNPITIAGALIPPGGDASKKNAYIVPTHWKRGLTVINAPAGIPAASAKALIANNIGRFATIDVDFDVRANETVGIINAPFCVAASNGTRKSPVDEGALGQKVWGPPNATATARGTRSEPFAKMSQAVAQMTDNTVPYEILVNGTIKGDVYACAEFDGAKVGDVTIRGVNGDNSIDVLDADKLGATSDRKYPVLAFRGTTGAKISATIQDLKITGGNFIDETSGLPNGGGISASYTDISLAKGALIAGNQARQGGGLYIKQGNLFVYADARVGEDGDETAGWNMAAGQCSNSANDCGGGIYCDTGGVYLGYKDLLTVATGADKWTGGVYRNHASCDGGGIYVVDGECRLAEGNVSRNSCSGDTGGGGGIFASGVLSVTGGKICGNKTTTKNGGGVCIGFCEFSMSGGEICDNEACLLGGGVCIGVINLDTSKFTMSGGEICGNKAADGGGIYGKDNVEVSLSGGKIANNDCGAVHTLSEKFTMGGSVWIPYGVTDGDTTVTGVGKNDVILNENRYITIESALSLPTGASGANATITPYIWKRGTVIAQGKNGGQLPTGGNGYLALADESGDGWATYGSSDGKQVKIKAPIYVYSADHPLTPGLDTNIGTKSAPYATVSHALTDLNDPAVDYKIYIYGTILDHVEITQTKENNAKSLLLMGDGCYNLNMATGILDGGCVASTPLESSAGRTLWVKGDVPVTLEGIAIKGGKVDGAGGGILVDDGADVALREYTSVTENYATGYGAGVYVDAGGTLNVKYNVIIKDNKKVNSSAVMDSNLFLPHGKVINVGGRLGDEHESSEIWVSTYDEPTISGTGDSATVTTVPITSNYATFNSVAPSKYFKGDKYGVALVGNEAALGANGGGITIDPMHDDVTFSADKTWAQKDGSDKITVSGTIDGQPMDFVDSTSANYTTLEFDVKIHGESAAGYYSKVGNDAVKFSGSKGKLPVGDYVLLVTGVHGGKTYSASFDIRIMENATVPTGYVITGGETVTGAVGTKSPSNVFIDGRSVNIPVIIACDHEVTQGEYEKYCCYYNTSLPSESKGKGEDYPVYYVSWCDAIVYCNLKSIADGLTPVYSLDGATNPLMWKTSGSVTEGTGEYVGKYCVPTTLTDSVKNNWINIVFDQNADGWRLPTEVEWEYLARAANKEDYKYSGSDSINEVGWYNATADGKTHEVKTVRFLNKNSANGLGLYDMSGNVCEWCWDWEGAPSNSTPYTGPDYASGAKKIYRGGSWGLMNSKSEVSYREKKDQYQSNDEVGFRVVRTVR